jgi:ABC-2 type transport system ATP-binding protein
MPAKKVIEAANLRKTYGKTVAVDDVSFAVLEGEIFGLIGPNGAGKTTTLECIEGLRKIDGGRISVLGLDPYRDSRQLQERLGVQLQQAQLQKRIKVWEAIDLWASLYARPVDGEILLEQLGLADKRDAWFMNLSGGQKQRLFIALALIHDPDLVFLDELTTGLDPQARLTIWELIRDIKERGKTVFLTTHLMEEAEKLCDRVAVIDHGRIIAMGTPADLVREHCPERQVTFSVAAAADEAAFRQVPGIESVEANGATLDLRGRGDDFVSDVIHAISDAKIRIRDFRTAIPTLEDVFLKLTGRSLRD